MPLIDNKRCHHLLVKIVAIDIVDIFKKVQDLEF